MPIECERSATPPSSSNLVSTKASEIKENSTNAADYLHVNSVMEGDMSTSQTSTTSSGSNSCNGGKKTSITSPDPTAYVAKARVTRPTPPPPPYNPMQFVQIKPCNLYQTAQEQLKKAEEVKKIKEIRKEEPEDWQNNLDNWKSSRRKRVEHIIDRVVEVKKLELEEHDRTRRKSKTFSEMIEERGERSGGRGLNKLASLAVYAEDEANDLSDLGIGTSSASGKSSLSEDYDNNSVMSDNAAELDKAITNNNHKAATESTTREYISSPGYETSSSTAPASSPDPCEYTYEGAIQDYKQRVSRAASGLTSVALNKLTSQRQNSKESTPERGVKETSYPPRRGSKIEDRLIGFEVKSPSEECVEKNKVDVPKIDISKRKEIFESQQQQQQTSTAELKSQQSASSNNTVAPRVTLRDRFRVQESSETLAEQPKKDIKRLSGDITSIKERLQSLEQQQNLVNGANGATKTTASKVVDIPVPPLKERLSSLQNAVTKEEVRKPPVVLVDARQLEIMKSEEEKVKQTLKETEKVSDAQAQMKTNTEAKVEKLSTNINKPDETKTDEVEEIDKDDSGIHTADDIEVEERLQVDLMKKEQELKLNAAIEALAKEEKQLSEAANAVNQIEAEFEELSLGSVALPPLASSNSSSATPITNDHMEYSVSVTNNSLVQTPKISCNNNSSSSSSTGSDSSNVNLLPDNEVKGVDFKTVSNLRRKPTNEMVHAKNLLKIFKETFQDDIESEDKEKLENKNLKDNTQMSQNSKETPISLNIKTQVFENSKNKAPSPVDKVLQEANFDKHLRIESVQSPCTSQVTAAQNPAVHNLSQSTPPNSPPSPMSSPSMIPLCMTSGKPPKSPKTIRSTTKFVALTPPGSPSVGRKSDSQFSINGRVEIFNSKSITSPLNSCNIVRPTTPTMTTKKTQLPYFRTSTPTSTAAATTISNSAASTPKSSQSNNIILPQQKQHNQQQQQSQEEATTKQQQEQQIKTTVIEPLSTTSATMMQTKQKVEQMKSMPTQQMVNEPQTKLDGETYHHHSHSNHSTDAVKHQQQPEVVVCAPPITIVNPDELPKPNTVKNLSSCFQQQDTTKTTVIGKQTVPKPLPRSRIPHATATPPQSPIASKRYACFIAPSSPPVTEQNKSKQSGCMLALDDQKKLSVSSTSSSSSTSTDTTVIEANKKLSIMSNASSISNEGTPVIIETKAQVHGKPEEEKLKACSESIMGDKRNTAKTLDKETDSSPNLPSSPLQSPKSELFKTTTPFVVSTLYDKHESNSSLPSNHSSPLSSAKPEEVGVTPTLNVPAELPTLIACPPNESTLYKLASSAPHSPSSPSSNPNNNIDIDSAICNSLLTSLAANLDVLQLQRQATVEEDVCEKVDKETLPFHEGTTGFADISKSDIKRCDGLTPSSTQKLQSSAQRQKTVEEELFQKLDINTLPDGKKQPITGFKCVSPTEIRKCDNFFVTSAEKPNSKPNSPMAQARSAHSKALIETCEKIIAEERLASSQLRSSLPSSPLGTPMVQKKSKIPKPISSCCTATESLSEADLKKQVNNSKPATPKDENNAVIARMHVVETQIKVTTTTPPASPKVLAKPQISSPQPSKKTRNIFDFLKKNFGVGGHSHKDDHENQVDNPTATTATPNTANKVLVLSEQELQDLEKVQYDEVHKFDNSKFYVPANSVDDEAAPPPPLPKTPAPVNIEITRKIVTDEIVEDGKTEMDLTKEIDDLLDDELNKLNYEIVELEKEGKKQ